MHRARRHSEEAGLTITSLMDAMTIILCFLLKSYEASDVAIAASDDLTLPASTALPRVREAVAVVVSRSGIVVDGEVVAALVPAVAEDGDPTWRVEADALNGELVAPLDLVLRDAADVARELDQALDGEVDFQGEVLIQADRAVPFTVVRQVLYTAGQAGFGKVRFVVIQS